jgi:hypothetical protein
MGTKPFFSLRILIAVAAAAALVFVVTGLSSESSRLITDALLSELLFRHLGFVSFFFPWAAVIPVLTLSGRASEALARMEHEGRAECPAAVRVTQVVSPYRAGAATLVIGATFLMSLFNIVSFLTHFPVLWMTSIGMAIIAPLLRTPRRVGDAWVDGDELHVAWDDGASFRVPFRSIDSVDQLLLDESDFPFERFGRGTWKPLIMSAADELCLRAIIEDPKRSRRAGPSALADAPAGPSATPRAPWTMRRLGFFSLRIVLAGVLAVVVIGAMTWIEKADDRFAASVAIHGRLGLFALAVLPLLLLSGSMMTAVSRLEHAKRRAAPARPPAPLATSPYRAIGAAPHSTVVHITSASSLRGSAVVLVVTLAMVLAQSETMASPQWPWMVAVATALLVPALLPPRRVGDAWVDRDALRVEWNDGIAFRVPLRSIASVEQLLRDPSAPFERFGRGRWRPLVMSKDHEQRLREIIDQARREPGSTNHRG